MAGRGPSSAFESETFGQDASFRLEQPVGSMSISPSGRDVALASKEGLHIIDLDSPYSPPRYLAHRTPWEVADVQWSPFSVRDYWVISTSNQKALVWNLDARSWQDPIEFVLHGHSRAITDINFSAHNPDVLATCAVDSFVHCWDLRAPSRPVNSFSDWFAGATQVKWNRQDEHVIASSHDKFLHIWDDRKGASPLRTIEAHGTKIYGIDWNRHEHNKIVTCSLDRTIKFWDFEQEHSTLEREIDTPFPVWRARHTPFGWGLLVMPQRGQSDLHLYDRRAVHGVLESGPVRPVATFRGHEGQVKEFLWRARGTIVDHVDQRDFQLVSWGTDQELKLHAIEPDMYADIGFEKGVSKVQRLNLTRKGAVYKTFRDVPGDTDSPLDEAPRSEMFSRHSQPSRFRPRSSTSVGMNKMPVSQFRGWVQGGRHTQRSGMHGRTNNRHSTDPISWLKNVKISSWDPDTLAEEIRHVGEKFKKVEFEMVDISHRKATMSLQAPWGEAQSQVFLRLEMRFPKLYPRNANAVLTLQKSGFLNEETYKLITTELHTIAETYASRKRACLEAILRYILKEQNLEQIVAWVLGESLADSKHYEINTIPVDDESSDSDDELGGVPKGLDASANILVPIAKGCGALWSDTGQLVCFFPAKGNEPASFLSMLGVKDLDESQSNKLFEGFGRFNKSSPGRKTTAGNKTADPNSDSETSDASWNSSSSDSSSFETERNERGVSTYKVGASALKQQSRSPDRSNLSTAGDGIKLNDMVPRKSEWSIRSYDDLIPSKRILALDYIIFGNRRVVCKHNADVAEKVGLSDLATAWTLVGHVLADTIPLDIISNLSHTTSQDIMIIARATLRNPKQKHPTGGNAMRQAYGQIRWGKHPLGPMYLIPAIFDHFERLGDVQMLAMLACVFASSIKHNTLANEHIVMSAPQPAHDNQPVRTDYFPSRGVARATLRKHHDTGGYVLVNTQTGSLSPRLQDASSTTVQKRPLLVSRQESQFSSRAASFIADDASDQTSPYSVVVSVSTSPEGNRNSQRSVRASLPAVTQSYAHSPPSQGGSSGIASSLKKYSPSGSLAPNWMSSGIFGSQNPGRTTCTSTRNTNSGFQDGGNRSQLSTVALRGSRKSNKTQVSSNGRGAESVAESEFSGETSRKNTSKSKRLRTRLFRQDHFDLDGYASTPLLDSSLEKKCKMYRTSYAQLLEVWQLPVQRAEMLKFDGVETESISQSKLTAAQVQHFGVSRPRRQTLTSASQVADDGLAIRRCCRGCGEPLDPIEKNGVPIGWQCISTTCIASNPGMQSVVNKVSKRSACAICNAAITGLAIPCLQCGHMTCYKCAYGWFGSNRVNGNDESSSRRPSNKSVLSPIQDTEDKHVETMTGAQDEHSTCPTGCGCPCATLTSITVPQPPTTTTLEATSTAVAEQEYLTTAQLTLQASRGSTTSAASTLLRSASLLAFPHSSSDSGPEGALAALLASTQLHQRSKSVHLAGARNRGAGPVIQAANSPAHAQAQSQNHSPNPSVQTGTESTASSAQVDEEGSLNPFTGSKIASLGRGIGAGLSRGLTSKASDATIRRVK